MKTRRDCVCTLEQRPHRAASSRLRRQRAELSCSHARSQEASTLEILPDSWLCPDPSPGQALGVPAAWGTANSPKRALPEVRGHVVLLNTFPYTPKGSFLKSLKTNTTGSRYLMDRPCYHGDGCSLVRPEAQSHEATWTGGQSQESSGLNPCSYWWDRGPKKGQRRGGRRTECNNVRMWLASHQPPNIPQDSVSHVPKSDFSRGVSLLSSSPSCPSFLPKSLSFGNKEFCFLSGMLWEPGTLISLSNILASAWNVTYIPEQTQDQHTRASQ